MAGRVIVLNGPGSAGKSTIARRIQDLAAAPLLHAQMDAFLDMSPERHWDHPDGLTFETLAADPPCVAVHAGPAARRLTAAFRRTVAELSEAGADVIADDLFWEDEAADYARLLPDRTLRFVLVTASLDVLEERERRRGDRTFGLPRWQASRVARAARWDLTVDASDASPEACARRIIDAFDL